MSDTAQTITKKFNFAPIIERLGRELSGEETPWFLLGIFAFFLILFFEAVISGRMGTVAAERIRLREYMEINFEKLEARLEKQELEILKARGVKKQELEDTEEERAPQNNAS